jgi:FKBP-type peptidyl-prolyl cis-trans isomerase
MKLTHLMACLIAFSLAACGQKASEPEETAEPTLDTTEQRLSYMVGNNMAQQFKRDGVEIDMAALSLGIDDAMADKDSKLTEEQVQETIATLQERAQKRQEEQRAELEKERAQAADKNKADGEAYLAENAKKEGWTTTESGLQYKIIEEGTGAQPAANDTVSVHYKGTLIDGTEFDSSYARGEPATFPVSGVIPGWVEALQLMKEKGKWQLAIPSDLAYGPGGTGGAIGPNATLIFDVELLEIIKPEAPEENKAAE